VKFNQDDIAEYHCASEPGEMKVDRIDRGFIPIRWQMKMPGVLVEVVSLVRNNKILLH
jgi:hypothetical protein